ncbi:MAG: glycosyltransferase [Nitrosomonadales bacterium]|jgi:glycosyltransferase involved in cell wall biosynthesis|nr:glycosyltransferase [Nitrosomonadales bacterium]|tara:strand:+ start:495 stop:1550 length:1056 start_codon:yes stop_codon:yes gene_type:complete
MKNQSILWWGRFDKNYSRNRIIRQSLKRLNYQLIDFIPLISEFGFAEAVLRNIKKTDFVWVPCFRQRDIASAHKWCIKHNIKLIIDPLISSWDKRVNEKSNAFSQSYANKIKQRESDLFNKADIIISDTSKHSELFIKDLLVKKNKVRTVFVGAEESIFMPQKTIHKPNNSIEILFYGSFISLQGTQVIVNAAKKMASRSNIKWTLLGNGPDLLICKKLAEASPHIFFEGTVDYLKLPERIHKADILLGIFGDSKKASNVIPNKVYQALACGKTVITRSSMAYPTNIRNAKNGIIFIDPNNPEALKNAVQRLVNNPKSIQISNVSARAIYDKNFSQSIIINQLQKVFSTVS